MGLGDWFRRKAEPAPAPAEAAPAGRRFHTDRTRMFDLQATHMLEGLFALPPEERDWAWRRAFWDHAWTASVQLAEPQVFTGPDGFPYLRLEIPRGAFDSQCLANVADFCIGNLVGAAFFAAPGEPPEAAQYVVSLGALDSLVRYDSPDGDPLDVEESQMPETPGVFQRTGSGESVIVAQEHRVLVGTPSAEYLPPHLARSLYQHLTQGWGLAEPRVQLVVDTHMRPTRSLMIGVSPGDFPPDADMDAMVQRLMWHLNPHRQIMLMPDGQSADGMATLRSLFEGR